MNDDRVIIPFPSDIIRLNGILQDTMSTIRCATSCLTYKAYIGAEFTFLLACNHIFMGALKSLSAKQEICIDGSQASAYAEKHMSANDISAEMVLTSLFIASIEKTMSMHSQFMLADSLDVHTEKSIVELLTEFGLLDRSDFNTEKATSLLSPIQLESIASTYSNKNLHPDNILTVIENVLTESTEKYLRNMSTSSIINSCARFAVFTYRKLHHIDSLTFADIDDWTMDTFDVIYS